MPSATDHCTPSAIIEVPPHTTPELNHVLKHDSSILALIVSKDSIYAGTQDGEIVVWSLDTFQQTNRIQAHKRSVMCLFLSEDASLLFSSASDPIVNVWCPRTMSRLCEIYSTQDSFGDIFSVAYSAQHDTVYYGAQNTSIQWVGLRDPARRVQHDCPDHPDRRNHRFFDSRAAGGTSTPRPTDERYDRIPQSHMVLETDRRAYKLFAHFGYVYCMLMTKGATAFADSEEDVLISGGGEGAIKVWKLGGQGVGPDGIDKGLEQIMKLGEDDLESVMSLAIDGSFLYSGKLRGVVELWDLDTKQRLRVIKDHKGDIMSLSMGWGYLWSTGSNGTSSKHSTVHYENYQPNSYQNVSQKYQCLTQWRAHDGKILASAVAEHQGNLLYITGANDNNLAVWVVENPPQTEQEKPEENEDMMISSLREFVSYKTISSKPEFAEDCRRGATFLRTLFRKLGGDVEMLSTDNNRHPVVFAKFNGKLEPKENRKRILFYGHYDVVPAGATEGKWNTDPFQLKGTNGYLYGRGVSDNKGPVVAALYAVTDLMQAKSLDSDIIFLIEGEEESGSRGFQETIRRNKERIGHIDYILLANSYWLNDEIPCLTYGLRGVLHATVCVQSKSPDLHSGVDGSCMVNEPVTDLTMLISKLKGPRNRILLPGFYDGVLPLTPEEDSRYNDIIAVLMAQNSQGIPTSSLRGSLMARWREPNLTIHGFKTSGAEEGSLVSSHASAHISFRLVPGQEVGDVINSLTTYLDEKFAELESDNTLTVKINNQAEPWLGDTDNHVFRTLEEAIIKAWAPLFDVGTGRDTETANGNDAKPRKPLYIREGGSIPAIRFLEKEFDAPAAHLPCGQASDSAHLDNERLRVINLLKSREIFGFVFGKL
ncbi:uncharacterized protein BCR38DRAFT_39305 [Pseudomassariella vexata]|uniref:Peptidase M20 dimerisation domain-containing protein n=1 Tax=Pseudomassariella vexata TaxID=1141098 RepID=A0A1Y2DR80_9PEZI|nr:uncharacterized protein BCR38DRAFT_39305 [Pseudomassariella vexata]ORY61771.1 hypothetical protein BCR38DRAFT_39305 [Pseudomassariella vexata]